MTSKYKKYPSYKDSGIEWIEEAPSTWTRTALKNVIKLQGGYAFKSELFQDVGIPIIRIGDIRNEIKWETTKKIPYENKVAVEFTIKPNDTLIALSGATTGKTCFVKEVPHLSYINQRVARLPYHNKFFYYVLNSDLFQKNILLTADGSAQENISNADIENMILYVPPLQEQKTIANYLDTATAKIDTLIEKQHKLIALLREKRQALISHAVTKGLNPNTPMKESGIAWLGEIPEGWKVKKLKYSARIQGGKDQKAVLDDDGKYPVYGSGGIFGYANQYLYNGESVLLGRKGTVDKPLYVNDKFWTVDTMYYTIIERVSIPKWLYYATTTIHFDYYQYGSAVPSMTQEDLHNIHFATPIKKEQQEIASYLDEKTQKIDTLITKATQAIALLKERRTALISAVVTGKIDVRGEVV